MPAKPDMSISWSENGVNVKPSDAKIDQGWIAEKPPFQAMNWAQNRADLFLQHINERGVAVWDPLTTYLSGAKVTGSNSVHYELSLSASTSINQDPTNGFPWIEEVTGRGNSFAPGQVISEIRLGSNPQTTAITHDVDIRQNAIITLGSNISMTITGGKPGGVYIMRVEQDGVGNRSIQFQSNVKWAGGAFPQNLYPLVPNSSFIASLYFDGTNFLASSSGEY